MDKGLSCIELTSDCFQRFLDSIQYTKIFTKDSFFIFIDLYYRSSIPQNSMFFATGRDVFRDASTYITGQACLQNFLVAYVRIIEYLIMVRGIFENSSLLHDKGG